MQLRGKPTLAVFGPDQQVKTYLMKVMEQSIGHLVNITGYSLDTVYPETHVADLVVTSGSYTLEPAKRIFPTSPVIAADRIVTAQNLEQILMLPRGTRALVVNHPRAGSEDTINSLRAFGIEHIHYEPFWREKYCNPDQIDVIITPGLLHWCPSELSVPIINIGERRIGVETFAKILQHFHFEMSYLRAFEQQYIGQHVHACQRIQELLERSEQLRRHQSVILHEIDEGILAMDQQGRIVISNPMINRLFGPDAELKNNGHLKRILKKLDEEKTTRDENIDSARSASLLVEIDGQSVYCCRNVIESENNTQTFYTFKGVKQIEALEHSVRRHVHNKGFRARYTFDDILGNSTEASEIKECAKRFAKTNLTILITGESGTGKELFAHAIHNASARANHPFVAVNLAAIPQSLLESELFGYQEGAFTGAKKGGKLGMFELAHGGTIFLDEIGDAPLHIQLLLLRVLEMREITRVGGEQSIPIDVRVIAATNCHLEEAIRNGTFRQDFYYRLNVLSFKTLPLRRMRKNLPDFVVNYFIRTYGAAKEFTPDAMTALQQYAWPGNFREFNNAMDYIYYTSMPHPQVDVRDFPLHITAGKIKSRPLHEALAESPALFAVLEVFAQSSPSPVSRRGILERLRASGTSMTEGVLKRHLGELSRLGALSVGITRQGTCITETGMHAYREFLSAVPG